MLRISNKSDQKRRPHQRPLLSHFTLNAADASGVVFNGEFFFLSFFLSFLLSFPPLLFDLIFWKLFFYFLLLVLFNYFQIFRRVGRGVAGGEGGNVTQAVKQHISPLFFLQILFDFSLSCCTNVE